ncbi:hypothetical protein, partial [Bacillus subtilis]|uniref:hypothetical protein n=1 Tax=Bacillus subtilis TaxID=1423 RepID=UPI0024AD069D
TPTTTPRQAGKIKFRTITYLLQPSGNQSLDERNLHIVSHFFLGNKKRISFVMVAFEKSNRYRVYE